MTRWFPLVLVLAGCASTMPEQTSERLLLNPPQDWAQVYQFNNQRTRLAEFVPPDETALEWQTKLTLESHADLVTNDPIEIVMAEIKRLQENCSFVQHFNLFSGLENDYPTSVRLVMCGENEGVEQGEISLIKAIQGDDYLYVIRVNHRVAPFEVSAPDVDRAMVGAWANYLSRVKLCDPEEPDHPCTADD